MRKSLLELQYLEEKKLYEELKKVENAEENYKMLTLYKSLSIFFFIMNLIIVILAITYEAFAINTNGILINLAVMILAIVSLTLLIISNCYKNKTLKILYNYYEKEKVLE